MNKFNLPTLIENKELNKIRKDLFNPYLIHKNILVCSYFDSWCLIVLNNQFEIIKKYWSEKEKVLKCFVDFMKHEKLNLSILGVRKINHKNVYSFKMDRDIRNCWFDGDFR